MRSDRFEKMAKRRIVSVSGWLGREPEDVWQLIETVLNGTARQSVTTAENNIVGVLTQVYLYSGSRAAKLSETEGDRLAREAAQNKSLIILAQAMLNATENYMTDGNKEETKKHIKKIAEEKKWK